ncbi:alpha/beta fold hydrolase [Blastochloris tepida]|uniref:Esterase n=1 Tax=Blastochloris tepida TaxID=2233851 RepID=A0A348G4H1_9HYPH|nr:alpha/beta hydrolase [Blastochloris tepida]BBF94454.1 esterase [Blastochloris tepida]
MPILTVLFALAAVLAAALGIAALLTRRATRRLEARFPSTGTRVDAGGGTIHVLRFGSAPAPDRPAVLLLHGAPGSAADLKALGERLTHGAAALPVLVPDRPGSGWSGRPGGDADAALGRQAALIRGAMQALGARRVLIVGHSFGGAVALRYALDHPDEVAGLVLVNPATHPRPGGLKRVQAAAEALLTGPLFTHTLATPLSLAALEKATARMFAPEPLPAGYLDASALALAMTPERFHHTMQDFMRLRGELIAQAPRYPALTAPLTLILGTADAVVPPADHGEVLARQLAGRAAPAVRVVRIEGAGHMLHRGHAGRVAEETGRLAGALLAEDVLAHVMSAPMSTAMSEPASAARPESPA